MPGEVTSCVGCHEERTQTVYKDSLTLEALKRAPSVPTPATAVPAMKNAAPRMSQGGVWSFTGQG